MVAIFLNITVDLQLIILKVIGTVHSFPLFDFHNNVGKVGVDRVSFTLINHKLDKRSLIKFMIDEGERNPIYTNLADIIMEVKEGEGMDRAYDFEDYKLKVNRYIEKNRDHLAIYKLRNN